MSDIKDKILEILDSAKKIILANIDKTYPPDGVDLIDETLNGSKEEFKSASGIAYREHPLTRLSSFLGLPNRKLYLYSKQSRANLFENFFGGQEETKSKYPRLRTTIIILLSFLFTPLRLALNLAKIATELIPGILADTITPSYKPDAQSYTHYMAGGLLFPWLLLKGIYLTSCCLSSPYDTLRSAWKEGMTKHKALAYIFCGICIATTIIMFGYALPIAAKILAAKFAPIIAHHLPTVIVNAVDKVAQVMTPAMTAIGNGFTYVIDVVIACANFPAVFGLTTLATVPALVGVALFVATAIATIGPQINASITRFKKWWHDEPEEDLSQDEGSHPNILNQQMAVLSALRAGNINLAENDTPPKLYDASHKPVELAELSPAAQDQHQSQNPDRDIEKLSARSEERLRIRGSSPAR